MAYNMANPLQYWFASCCRPKDAVIPTSQLAQTAHASRLRARPAPSCLPTEVVVPAPEAAGSGRPPPSLSLPKQIAGAGKELERTRNVDALHCAGGRVRYRRHHEQRWLVVLDRLADAVGGVGHGRAAVRASARHVRLTRTFSLLFY